MREQLHRINGFLADQAIYLSLTNDKLKALALRMANKGYSYWSEHGRRRVDTKVLNFSQVSLRRIFAKGRLDRGGRFYKGWWQTIPKQFRCYITINGQPALEVDFSEMHPTMLYLLSGQSPPDSIYDLGIRALQGPRPASLYPTPAVRQPDASVHSAHVDPHGCPQARGAGRALGRL